MWRLVFLLALASARYFSDTVTMMDWTEDALPRYAAMMRWSQTSFGDTVPIHSDVVDEGRHGPVNAALTPIYDALGVGVSGPFFTGSIDRFVQEFVYLHEIGHASTEHVLAQFLPDVQRAMHGRPEACIAPVLSGAAVEVLADLSAACYMALQPGFDASSVKLALKNGVFDTGWSGHHPPGHQRVKYINTLWRNLAGRKTLDFVEDCVPLMREQLMYLDEQSRDFDPSGFCA